MTAPKTDAPCAEKRKTDCLLARVNKRENAFTSSQIGLSNWNTAKYGVKVGVKVAWRCEGSGVRTSLVPEHSGTQTFLGIWEICGTFQTTMQEHFLSHTDYTDCTDFFMRQHDLGNLRNLWDQFQVSAYGLRLSLQNQMSNNICGASHLSISSGFQLAVRYNRRVR